MKWRRRILGILDQGLDALIMGICGILLFVSVYSMVDNYQLQRGARDPSLMAFRPGENQVLSEVDLTLDKQAAWLQLYDTTIDFPVMQGVDNYEFLNKDPYGEFKLSGSIFLDYRNAADFSDPYTVIYGHHMDRGSMFGALDDYIDKEYYDAHRLGRIVTKDAAYMLELFAVAAGDGTDPTVFSPEGRTTEEITAYLDKNAMIYTGYTPGDRIVALTTCWGDTMSSRLLVFGVIHEV